MTVAELLARSQQAAREVFNLEMAAAIEAAARRCVAAGRPELAAELAAAVPKKFRAGVLAIAASGGAGSIDAAIDAILEGAAANPEERPAWASLAFEAARDLEGKSSRTRELTALVDAIIEEAFADEPPWGTEDRFKELGRRWGSRPKLFTLLVDSGAAKRVHEVLVRAMKQFPVDPAGEGSSCVGMALDQEDSLVWKLGATPKQTLALLATISPWDLNVMLVNDHCLRACVAWSREDLDRLIAIAPIREELATELVACGRVDDARAVLFPTPADPPRTEPADPVVVARAHARRLLILGDTAAARAILADVDPARSDDLRIEAGSTTIAKELERIDKRSAKEDWFFVIGDLLSLATIACDRKEYAQLEAIVTAVERRFGSKQLTGPNKSREHTLRTRLAALRVTLAATRGPSAARAAIESSIAGLPALLAYCEEAHYKRGATSALVGAALQYGCPDLAHALGQKFALDDSQRVAIAQAFLPADPAMALHTLTKRNADRILVDRLNDSFILAELWSAVLAPATA